MQNDSQTCPFKVAVDGLGHLSISFYSPLVECFSWRCSLTCPSGWLFASLSGLPWESPRQSLERPQAFSFGGTSSAWVWACVESSATTVADIRDGQRKCDMGPQRVSGTSMCSFRQFSHAFKNIQIRLSIYIYTYTHFYTLIFFPLQIWNHAIRVICRLALLIDIET